MSGIIGSLVLLLCVLLGSAAGNAQDDASPQSSAGYVPVISGGFAYIQNSSGGVQTLEPQIIPVLLVPMGHSVLLESRVEFTGFFQREVSPSGSLLGPYAGKVYKTVDYAQLEWLADSHAMFTAGRFILPFGLYSERLTAIWGRNLQDLPLTYTIGTRPYGAADGLMVRGVAASLPSANIQYSAFVSTHSLIEQLQAVRAAGADTSIFLPSKRVEVGLSYERTLEGYQVNSEAAYLSWQPERASTDLKAEYDRTHFGHGYWIEAAHSPQQFPIAPDFFRHVQLVGRMEQFFIRNGGGNGFSQVNEQRPEVGLNYQIRDDWRLESNYGRLFSKNGNENVWNFGFTYRFIWPLWSGRKS
ncbi:MAG: hypothetical protein ABSE51_00585 [Terracidiphilus sp.]